MCFKRASKIMAPLVLTILFNLPYSVKAYANDVGLPGIQNLVNFIGGTLNILLPELIMDCHSGNIHSGLSWEVPFQGNLGDRMLLFDPAFNYYVSEKVKGVSYTQYIEPFSFGVKNISHYLGCGFIKDTYGYSPKFDYRINIGDSKSWGSVNYILNISYIPKINKKFERYLISTGFKMYF